MPTKFDIQQRIAQRISLSDPVFERIVAALEQQCWQGRLSSEKVMKLCQAFELSVIDLALKCVELAACYALTPVSHFNVGAVAIGQSGTFYFGANLEFSTTAMSQTVHAEQSAISHAWIAGEKGITDIVVNYTPCGHCRQFMNEMKGARNYKFISPIAEIISCIVIYPMRLVLKISAFRKFFLMIRIWKLPEQVIRYKKRQC